MTRPTVAPTSTLALSAVSWISAISPSRVARWPRRYVAGSKRAGGVENTSGGAPPLVLTRLGLPFSNTTREPSASISPVAAAAPGTLRTRSRTEAGKGSWKPLLSSLTVRR